MNKTLLHHFVLHKKKIPTENIMWKSDEVSQYT